MREHGDFELSEKHQKILFPLGHLDFLYFFLSFFLVEVVENGVIWHEKVRAKKIINEEEKKPSPVSFLKYVRKGTIYILKKIFF